jgi:deferrochelatase/peroxidase EfeB
MSPVYLLLKAVSCLELVSSGAGRAVSVEDFYVFLENLAKEKIHIGAPIDVFPTEDHPEAGKNPNQNNDFRYAFPNDQQTQDRCPFAAHTRKTNPRADLEDHVPPLPVPPTGESATSNRRIIRRGVQFGPEVTASENASGKTEKERGLLFAAYQSVLTNGFEFIQESKFDLLAIIPIEF